MSTYKLFTDGAITKNPGGEASYGFVLYKDNKKISFGYGIIGSGAMMNNELAECYAISQGLSEFLRHWDTPKSRLTIYNDNQYVLSQIYKNKNIRQQLKQLEKLIDVSVKWIPRSKNTEADKLTKRLRTLNCLAYSE